MWQQVLSFRPSIHDLPLFLQGVLIAVMFGRLFYDSWIAVAVLLPVAFPWFVHGKLAEKRRNTRLVGIQFKDAIASVLTGLKAGYSVENAFVESCRDMDLLYGKNSLISRHFHGISKGIKNNVPLEKLMFRLGRETGNKDIRDFAEVFAVAKRSGGNLREIIEKTIFVISKKMEVEKEIDVLISAKKMESRIMNLVPFFIIFYITLTSPGFFEPLYHNVFGVIMMTVCMVFYGGAYLLSERIVNIDV